MPDSGTHEKVSYPGSQPYMLSIKYALLGVYLDTKKGDLASGALNGHISAITTFTSQPSMELILFSLSWVKGVFYICTGDGQWAFLKRRHL